MQKIKVNPILRLWCLAMSNRRRADLMRHLQARIKKTTGKLTPKK